MNTLDPRELNKAITKEYIEKGYSDEQLDQALRNDLDCARDTLVEVTGYDLVNKKILGIYHGKPCEVSISPNVVEDSEKMLTSKFDLGEIQKNDNWFGHRIDEKMQNSVPKGSVIVVEMAMVQRDSPTHHFIGTYIHRVDFKNDVAPPIKHVEIPVISKKIRDMRGIIAEDYVTNSFKPKK